MNFIKRLFKNISQMFEQDERYSYGHPTLEEMQQFEIERRKKDKVDELITKNGFYNCCHGRSGYIYYVEDGHLCEVIGIQELNREDAKCAKKRVPITVAACLSGLRDLGGSNPLPVLQVAKMLPFDSYSRNRECQSNEDESLCLDPLWVRTNTCPANPCPRWRDSFISSSCRG